jgi:hypothetical protein
MFSRGGVPAFVETLDAVEVGKKAGMPITSIMIYGDDVSHVVNEELKRVSLTQRGNPETTSRE